MPHSLDNLLLDIRISCEEIIEFCKSKDSDKLRLERMLQLAMEREFEIIGEALLRMERLSLESLESKIPEYRKIIGFINLVAHRLSTLVNCDRLYRFENGRVVQSVVPSELINV
ncbi:hypothetical protein OAQ34_03835 [Opitutales bacterium]|nr:hypothetical protein [Opitutales bacterium]